MRGRSPPFFHRVRALASHVDCEFILATSESAHGAVPAQIDSIVAHPGVEPHAISTEPAACPKEAKRARFPHHHDVSAEVDRQSEAVGHTELLRALGEEQVKAGVRLPIMFTGLDDEAVEGQSARGAAAASYVVDPIEALKQPMDGFAHWPWEGGETVRHILGFSNWS